MWSPFRKNQSSTALMQIDGLMLRPDPVDSYYTGSIPTLFLTLLLVRMCLRHEDAHALEN